MHFKGLIPPLVSVPPATVHGRYGMKSLPLSKLLLQQLPLNVGLNLTSFVSWPPFGLWTRVSRRKHLLHGGHIGATWRIQLNRPCAAAMRPYMSNYFDHLLLLLYLLLCLRVVGNLESGAGYYRKDDCSSVRQRLQSGIPLVFHFRQNTICISVYLRNRYFCFLLHTHFVFIRSSLSGVASGQAEASGRECFSWFQQAGCPSVAQPTVSEHCKQPSTLTPAAPESILSEILPNL